MTLKTGQLIAGRYEITDKLGAGGMSIVYKAIDRKLGRAVSLKVLREEHSVEGDFRDRLIHEAKAVASLNHPNIVNVYDVGQDGGIFYIVMEYIDGTTLKELIDRHAPFSDEEALGVAVQVSVALGHAHESGIIHRDIKPENILVTDKGSVIVTDFGIAHKTNKDTVTVGATTMGSVHYFSPEQARGGYVDQKSDLYSLGIVMFEMLTGRLPFEADTAVSVALKQINDPMPSLTSVNPDIDKSIEALVMKLTEKSPLKRYQTAEELTKDLRLLLSNPGTEVVAHAKRPELPTLKITKDEFDTISKEAGEYDGGHDSYEGVTRSRRGSHDDIAERRKDRNIIIAATVTAVLLTAFLVFMFAPGFLEDMKPTPTPSIAMVVVPEFVGLPFEEGEAEAKKLGLKLEIFAETYSDDFEEGYITEANYKKGDLLYPDDVVQVVISLGTDKIETPDLIGEEYRGAYEKIQNLPFSLEDRYEFNENEIGRIFDQEPKPGEPAEPGTVITLFISRGREYKRVTVPKLTGLKLDAALALLKSNGLESGNVSYSTSENYAEGLVMLQTVREGDEVVEGALVGIVVSSGPPKPDPTPDPTQNPDTGAAEDVPPGDNPDPGDENNDNENNDDGNNEEEVEPVQTPEPAVLFQTIQISDIAGLDSANVKVTRYEDLMEVTVFEKYLQNNELPFDIVVTGSGSIVYNLYINGFLHRQFIVDFSEGH